MINISGYISGHDEEIEEQKKLIAVNSCGFYKLVKQPQMLTIRPEGRLDFQLLYILKGKMTFTIGEKDYIASEGTLFFYFPRQPQYYYYKLVDSPEVYWLHFSGAGIREHLAYLGFQENTLYPVGFKNEYTLIFDKIIKELQLRRAHFSQLTDLYGLELLTQFSRSILEAGSQINYQNGQIQNIIELINKDISNTRSINEYAKMCNMSTCWFINCFKAYTGLTPQQYITGIRIIKARELLSFSSLNVNEIATIVGYDNPFYFSRIFKKNTGVSPQGYKNAAGQKYTL